MPCFTWSFIAFTRSDRMPTNTKYVMENSKTGKTGARRRVHERRKRRREERRNERLEKKQKCDPELGNELVRLQKLLEEKNKELETQKCQLEDLKLLLEKEKEFRRQSTQLPAIRPWDLTLGQKIGRGSYGTVFRARFGCQDVVVKELERTTTLKMAQTEAHFLHYLRHPNLPHLIGVDFTLANTNFKIVMPLYSVDGSPTSLFEAMNSQMIKVDVKNTWINILSQVTKAICYLHTVGVLHNDLKSNNVVIHKADQSLTAIIIDFGKASFLSDKTQKTSVSKPRHIAPEQQKSKASDIFSLGCILKDAYALIKDLQMPLFQELYRKCRELAPEKRSTSKEVYKWLQSFMKKKV